ncbi:Nucleotidylyl transferase [Xylona heveae TC161]|uniref:tyrosine--tRNA ligase n=1 Tax=Xylona heveae (strain CBS 132557 / TC161) TaxID=1328760 RepID=A0A165JXQ5_XYLHT|nr:Nucleotidylyl transferase [Xylona heveae TC161]KZF26758.1 Nucleotidylyl transferase [Xylona heveae TC161]
MASISDAILQRKLDLITRRLTEVDGLELVKSILAEGRSPKTFWATAPTGKPHIAYFVPITKFADFARAGVDVTVLICDLYAFLINFKYPYELVRLRAQWYRFMISAVLDVLGVPRSKIRFVEGSSYELSPKFTLELYKLTALTEQADLRAIGDELHDTSKLSPLLTPGITALAEEYLNIDFQFGGEDQRGLFRFNKQSLSQMGYRTRGFMMNPMVPGLSGPKMSSSIPDSKIEFLDPPEEVSRKIAIASCNEGDIIENGVLALLRFALIPVSELRWETRETRHEKVAQTNDIGFPSNGFSSNGIDLNGSGFHDIHVNGHHANDIETNGSNVKHVNAERDINGFGILYGLPLRPFCSKDAPEGTVFTVSVGENTGDEPSQLKHYGCYQHIEDDFAQGIIKPANLRRAVAAAVNDLIAPLRRSFEENKEWQKVDRFGYPEEYAARK